MRGAGDERELQRQIDAVIDRIATVTGEAASGDTAAASGYEDIAAVALSEGADLAQYIDYTLLRADVTRPALERLCREALEHRFAAVCVNGVNVAYCHALLGASPVAVAAVVGFPLGAMSPEAKAFEAAEATRQGAVEIDVVLDLGALKDGRYLAVLDDLRGVVRAAGGAQVKVILETGLLDIEHKIAGCLLARHAGAHAVKTSTGFGHGGATREDVALMRRLVGRALGVKASGGIRTREQALQLIAAGASRIGTSAILV